MVDAPFRLTMPAARTTSVVFASPHSGRDYPRRFRLASELDAAVLRSSEDAYVDDLFAPAPGSGAPLIAATLPRAYVDLNRAADELDPALIEGVRRSLHNPRIASGLGVIPRVVANGRAIYRGKLPFAEAEARLSEVWRPYHAALRGLLAESHAQFGEAILIDCHSMPHEALEAATARGPAPEIVLGDRFGSAAGGEVVERIERAFLRADLRVVRNAPFAGAYVTQHYGRPARRQHAVQIEIDRSLYMDEQRIAPHAGFEAFRARLGAVVAEIAQIGSFDMPLAAE
ncbi:N-formylglutamate amidohydrolase [Mesobaculum littorinae]|uniref:N-formylglutamate amidohydrolase n=1 Tax=Mesobaculum littorinae TaxID=2486419 RepID=A0A438AHY1_9RHOB|nr:N-formylglutamate amidohydrolase [Mesobaculum littorinae]RVV98197.1 N-formylglutamate amidohydrolase [Mesobaculum littorinae]